VDGRLLLGIVVGLVVVWLALFAIFWMFRPKGTSTREIVRLVPDVLRLLRSLIGDGSTPVDVRVVLVGLLAWIVSPIDLIPDFIPVLGPLDDVVVTVVALRYARRRVGSDELRARWAGSDDSFAVLSRVIGT
jgi:uncharacterized membrane protein YkvA (DUF1232 family)